MSGKRKARFQFKNTDSNLDLETFILELLQFYVCVSGQVPSQQDRIVEDLQAQEDIIDFIAKIEEQLNIKIPVAEWEVVETVNDIILLIKKYIKK
ncbi:MAG: hypothetical protein J7641_19495 [Cyanobacteria bacterium SID2]|nr:hypothetical protein [Cyanobacteria bacterium SID2]